MHPPPPKKETSGNLMFKIPEKSGNFELQEHFFPRHAVRLFSKAIFLVEYLCVKRLKSGNSNPVKSKMSFEWCGERDLFKPKSPLITVEIMRVFPRKGGAQGTTLRPPFFLTFWIFDNFENTFINGWSCKRIDKFYLRL